MGTKEKMKKQNSIHSAIAPMKSLKSRIYERFRNLLQKLDHRAPTLYQHAYKGALWLIDMLPLLLNVIGASGWLMVILLVIAFFFGIMLYGATLKNKYDSISKNELNSAIDTLSEQEKELKEYKINNSLMYYQLAKRISDGCSYMLQEGSDKDERLLSDLTSLAYTMETTLTKHYGFPVSVNIKLCVPNNCVRTFARGKNNIISRGGEHVIFELNEKNIPIAENYALNLISSKQIECFIEGDLINMKTATDIEDTFTCDRENWFDYFTSTAIFAIRGRVQHQPKKHNIQYEVHGFICIDAKDTNDWCKNEKCIVYTFGAFCANMLYEYLAAYKTAEMNRLERGTV